MDYGHKNIGLSWGSDALKTAIPLRAIVRAKNLETVLQRIQCTLEEHDCDAFVLGLPLHMDGTAGKRVQEVRAFAEHLQVRFAKPIFYQDERLSTQTAAGLSCLKSHSHKRIKKDKKNGAIDSKSAMIILQDFLDALP